MSGSTAAARCLTRRLTVNTILPASDTLDVDAFLASYATALLTEHAYEQEQAFDLDCLTETGRAHWSDVTLKGGDV